MEGTAWNTLEAGMFIMRCVANKVGQRYVFMSGVVGSFAELLVRFFEVGEISTSDHSRNELIRKNRTGRKRVG